MDQMEKDVSWTNPSIFDVLIINLQVRLKISRAQTRIKTGLNSTKKQIQKKSKADGAVIKRTWLKDVDYKNGGLLSENKKKLSEEKKKAKAKRNQNENEINDNEPDMQEPKKKKKSNFLSKAHKEEHDNIFSKKFKQNKFEDKRRKKK